MVALRALGLATLLALLPTMALADGGKVRIAVMEVRVLVSARNAPRTFDLRCEMREKRVDFIQREMPHALPRTREEVRATSQGALLGDLGRAEGQAF